MPVTISITLRSFRIIALCSDLQCPRYFRSHRKGKTQIQYNQPTQKFKNHDKPLSFRPFPTMSFRTLSLSFRPFPLCHFDLSPPCHFDRREKSRCVFEEIAAGYRPRNDRVGVNRWLTRFSDTRKSPFSSQGRPAGSPLQSPPLIGGQGGSLRGRIPLNPPLTRGTCHFPPTLNTTLSIQKKAPLAGGELLEQGMNLKNYNPLDLFQLSYVAFIELIESI